MKFSWKLWLLLALLFIGLGWFYLAHGTASATELSTGTTKEVVDDLNHTVKEKKDRIDEISSLIDTYRDRIRDQESKQASLANEVLLLENRVREKELGVLKTQEEINVIGLEIEALQDAIQDQQTHIESQKEMIGQLLRRLHQADEVTTLDVLLTRGSLSDFFDHLERVKRVEKQLGGQVNNLKLEKQTLNATQKQQTAHRDLLIIEGENLKKEQIQLASEKEYKTSLISETQNSQEEFERIIFELRQQQQQTSEDISRLEDKLREKLDSIDDALARGDLLLSWPVYPAKGVSASFHDSTYPFRHLFEHSGTDIPTPAGTPVKAPAGGYVAWHRTGRLYGNYIMIVHPGGIATVYAHLSKFVAPADSYVERGDVIALSGGVAGAPGAGLSTGAHLHFEVRQNGIPVDAENFLPSIR
ncbi:MAG: peptidoglycan DD-metalloendopeptidase family protein [bacterium]|nr:peptidoglycan DD-metalloendopeptidase family protein [bacterium]